jgi:hypothetical protein
MEINWGTVVTSLVANAALLGTFWKTLTDRMLANLAAKNEQELERFKLAHAQALAGYQNQLDKTILVTKVHFETEFSALKESFQKLAEVRLTMAVIRPFQGLTYEGETKENKLTDLAARLEQLKNAYNELVATTENLRPFYPHEIYANFGECRSVAHIEITEVLTSGDAIFTSGWYAEGARNLEKFLKAYNTVSDLVRDHIAKLAIAR